MGHGGPAAAGNRTRVSKERIPRVLPLDHCDKIFVSRVEFVTFLNRYICDNIEGSLVNKIV